MENLKLVFCGLSLGAGTALWFGYYGLGVIFLPGLTYQIVFGLSLAGILSTLVGYRVFTCSKSADSEDFGIFAGMIIPLLVIDIVSLEVVPSVIIGSVIGLIAAIGAIVGVSLANHTRESE